MVIVLDVETISMDYNFICDIAWGTVDRNKLVQTKNYLPTEHMAKMASGFFSKPKMTKTMEEVAKGNAIIKPYDEIMGELMEDIGQAKHVYAYNANFDRNAISKTCKVLQSKFTPVFDSEEVFNKWRDLWAWASHTILYKKSFIDFCEANNLKTPKGYYSTSAETTLKYLKKDTEYVESHTALEDIKDEYLIYLAIKNAVKKEFPNVCQLDDNDFKGKPFFVIKKLNDAMTS